MDSFACPNHNRLSSTAEANKVITKSKLATCVARRWSEFKHFFGGCLCRGTNATCSVSRNLPPNDLHPAGSSGDQRIARRLVVDHSLEGCSSLHSNFQTYSSRYTAVTTNRSRTCGSDVINGTFNSRARAMDSQPHAEQMLFEINSNTQICFFGEISSRSQSFCST